MLYISRERDILYIILYIIVYIIVYITLIILYIITEMVMSNSPFQTPHRERGGTVSSHHDHHRAGAGGTLSWGGLEA